MICSYEPPTQSEGTKILNQTILDPLGRVLPTKVDFRNHASDLALEFYYTEDYNVNAQSRLVNDNISEMHYSLLDPLLSFIRLLNHYSLAIGDSNYGKIDAIGHLGIKRSRAGSPSYHYAWQAIDLTYVHWDGGNISRPHSSWNEVALGATATGTVTKHRRLVAVEAALRYTFGYVLNRYIGDLAKPPGERGAEGPKSPHINHFHADNGCSVALIVDHANRSRRAPTRSCHYFVQDCINAFTDHRVTYDGRWGNNTEAGYATLLSDLGMERLEPVRYITHYRLFLAYIIMHGLADVRAGQFRYHGP